MLPPRRRQFLIQSTSGFIKHAVATQIIAGGAGDQMVADRIGGISRMAAARPFGQFSFSIVRTTASMRGFAFASKTNRSFGDFATP